MIVVSEAEGAFRGADWTSGKVYDLQEVLEICWLRQEYIDEFKRVSGLPHGPWVVITPWPIPEGLRSGSSK